jgi:hypothetical protein
MGVAADSGRSAPELSGTDVGVSAGAGASHAVVLHGYVVGTSLPVGGVVVREYAREPDLVVEVGAGPVAVRAERVGSESWEVAEGGAVRSVLTLHGAGFVLRWPSLLEVALEGPGPDGRPRALRFAPEPGTDVEYVSMMLNAAVGAVAMADGALVLHASAVAVEGAAVLILAPSGAGKSSLAAIAVACGADAVAEDVVVIDHGPGTMPTVRRGVTELRLRRTNADVADLLAALPSRPTVDGRVAVLASGAPGPEPGPEPGPDEDPGGRVPVRRIVVPILDPDAAAPSARRMGPADAVSAVMSHLRFGRPAQRSSLVDTFGRVAELVSVVPVEVVTVPWRRPIDAATASAIAAAVLGAR